MTCPNPGNLLPLEWSWAGHVVQHIMVALTWASMLVSEVFFVTIAHHTASYYAALNVHLQNYFGSWISQVRAWLLQNDAVIILHI